MADQCQYLYVPSACSSQLCLMNPQILESVQQDDKKRDTDGGGEGGERGPGVEGRLVGSWGRLC